MRIIRTFWHGSQLSIYEKLCIKSYLHHGHLVEVYSYEELELPEGAILKDASEILPKSEIFFFNEGPGKYSIAGFSDRFRYKLIYEKGGIWSDLDVLCLKSYSGLPEAFFAYQEDKSHKHAISTGIFSLPPKSNFAKLLYEESLKYNENSEWGESGPGLVTKLFNAKLAEGIDILDVNIFYPISYKNALNYGLPEEKLNCDKLTKKCYGAHWWNEIWRRHYIPKDKLPPADSFLSQHANIILAIDGLYFWDKDLFENWLDSYVSIETLTETLNLKEKDIETLTETLKLKEKDIRG